jgi:hypothetical protein
MGIALATTAQHFDHPAFGRLHSQLNTAGPGIYALMIALLVAGGVAVWAGTVLYRSGDDFNNVARTDLADQDFLARGLDRLRLFFKIQVLMTVFWALVSVATVVVVLLLRETQAG